MLRDRLLNLLGEIYLSDKQEIIYKGLRWAEGGLELCLEEILKLEILSIANKKRARQKNACK